MSRRLDDLDAVLEFDASDDFRQLVFALQSAPCFGGRRDELEDHELGGSGRQRSFRPHGSVPHRGEHALDRVRGTQVVPVLGGLDGYAEQRLSRRHRT